MFFSVGQESEWACRGVLCAVLAALASGSATAQPTPAGQAVQLRFCGTVYDSPEIFADYGLTADTPFLGVVRLVRRDPDSIQPSGATQWDCEANDDCGEFRVTFSGFAPPQTAP